MNRQAIDPKEGCLGWYPNEPYIFSPNALRIVWRDPARPLQPDTMAEMLKYCAMAWRIPEEGSLVSREAIVGLDESLEIAIEGEKWEDAARIVKIIAAITGKPL